MLVSGAGVAAHTAYDLTAEFASDAVDLPGQEQVPPDIGAIETGVDLYIAGTDESSVPWMTPKAANTCARYRRLARSRPP